MSDHPTVNDCNSKGMVPGRSRRNDRSTQYIDHSTDIASSISGLYGNDQFSDVTLVVQGVQFKAHRIILAARSEYFRALLYGGLAESSRSIIHLNDINAVAFKQVLLYIYTGRLNVQQLRTMLDVLGLAHQYDFQRLESALSTHLTRSLRLSNVWFIYNLAVLYNLEELINACLTFLDGIAPAPLYSPHFLRLSQPAVERLLSRDSFCASEIEIFRSLCAWFRANEDVDSPPGVDQMVSKDCIELFRGTSAPSALSDTAAKVQSLTTDDQPLPVESGDTKQRDTEQKDYKGGEPPPSSESATSKCVSPDSHMRSTSEDEATRRIELPRCQMIRRCVRFELMSLCDLLTEVRASKLVSPDDLLDAISRQAKASNELPHRGWLLPGINLASPRFAASLVAGEEGSYPYFFVDDADNNHGDFTKLHFALSSLRSSVAPTSDADLVRLMDDELDEEEMEESEEDAEEPEGEPQLPSSSRSEPTGTDQFHLGAGNHNFNTTYFVEPQSPHTRVLSSGLGPSGLHTSSDRAQARTLPVNEPHQSSMDPHLRHTSQRSRMSTIATGSTSTADTTATPAVGTAWQSGSMHLNHHQLGPALYRSMRWLQPSRCARGRIASHPPPPPHSEHDVVRHSLDDPDAHIVIRLGKPSIVNTIRMQLWDREIRRHTSQRSRMSTIATGSTSTADTTATPAVGTAWQSGSMHLNHHQIGPALYRSMRWLQPSRCARGRIASHPPPPPHSEHDVVRHSLDDPDAHIVIRLGKPSIVNTIRMQLWDREIRCYSYYVEVSLDQTSWYRVVDYRNYLCRSWQTLHFPARVVHYIRITGTRNTANRTFHLITFRCLYTDHVCRQLDGFLVPNYNVASVEHGATVLEGVSRNRNALIDGNARMYDWNSGYTCHQLGNGAIVVQLSQPFLLRSMRFLLWDLDDRTYSYSVHVSTNREEWRLIHDATRERCQSWQVITFPLQLVTFIRVIGTHNTANE
ncbi:BTB/POZ domain-containing protein 9, partial [Paragonimus westermani]